MRTLASPIAQTMVVVHYTPRQEPCRLSRRSRWLWNQVQLDILCWSERRSGGCGRCCARCVRCGRAAECSPWHPLPRRLRAARDPGGAWATGDDWFTMQCCTPQSVSSTSRSYISPGWIRQRNTDIEIRYRSTKLRYLSKQHLSISINLRYQDITIIKFWTSMSMFLRYHTASISKLQASISKILRYCTGSISKVTTVNIEGSQNWGNRYQRSKSSWHIVTDIWGHFLTFNIEAISKVARSRSKHKDMEGPAFDIEGWQGSRWQEQIILSYTRYMAGIWTDAGYSRHIPSLNFLGFPDDLARGMDVGDAVRAEDGLAWCPVGVAVGTGFSLARADARCELALSARSLRLLRRGGSEQRRTLLSIQWHCRPSGTLRYYDIIVFLWYHSLVYDIIVNIIPMIS